MSILSPLPSPETVTDRLGAALKRYCETVDILPGMAARRVETATRYGWDCAAGRAVPAEQHLRFAHLLAIDPDTGHGAGPDMLPRRGPISWAFFATGLRGRMLIDGLNVRETARLAGVSGSTVSRATDGQIVAASSFIRLSRFLRRHPNEWTLGEPGGVSPKIELKHVDPVQETETEPA